MKRKIALVTINEPGLQSALRLFQILNRKSNQDSIQIFCRSIPQDWEKEQVPCVEYSKIDEVFAEHWSNFSIFVCFLATGIIIRKIAPLLRSKTSDPAILAMSFDLKQVIPLLSGHLGGANDFANELTQLIPDCTAFITTATDQTQNFSFDLFAQKQKFVIQNIENLARLSNALINKQKIRVISYPSVFKLMEQFDYFNPSDFQLDILNDQRLIPFSDIETVIISPYEYPQKDWESVLQIKIKPIVLGIGLNRDTPADILEKALQQFLWEHHLSLSDVQRLASFQAKADEPGLHQLAENLNLPLSFYGEKEINSITDNFSSSKAQDYFNIQGVAEPSAILASNYKTCFLRKHSYFQAVTLSAAF